MKNQPPAIASADPSPPNGTTLVMRREGNGWLLPATIAHADEKTQRRFLEFFAATIRNKNTREAYYRAVCKFFTWCEKRDLREQSLSRPGSFSR